MFTSSLPLPTGDMCKQKLPNCCTCGSYSGHVSQRSIAGDASDDGRAVAHAVPVCASIDSWRSSINRSVEVVARSVTTSDGPLRTDTVGVSCVYAWTSTGRRLINAVIIHFTQARLTRCSQVDAMFWLYRRICTRRPQKRATFICYDYC